QEVTGNLRVKEVRISEDERFVICHDPDGAERDAATRARLLTRLKEMIDGTDKLTATRRAELRGVSPTKPGLNRYLRVTPGRLLIRSAESAAGTTWNKIADELSLLTLGTFTGPDGTFRQTAELTQGQRGILASRQIPSPRKIIEAAPAAAPAPGEAAASA